MNEPSSKTVESSMPTEQETTEIAIEQISEDKPAPNEHEEQKHMEIATDRKLEFDAISSEYDQLRNEVIMRLQKQQEITSFSIAMLVGFVALNQYLSANNTTQIWNQNAELFYPIASIIFSAFTLMVLEHEVNIAQIYIYADQFLKRRINEIISGYTPDSSEVWKWNKFRTKIQYHSGFTASFSSGMAWSKYAMTLIPNICLLGIYISNDYTDLQSNFFSRLITVQAFLLLIALSMFTWMSITALYVARLYFRMEH